MKSLMRLLSCVLEDSSIRCCTSTARDFETITRRVEHEGLSFLTITLPTFAQDFERSLEEGRIDHTRFSSFKKNGALPNLLRGLLGLVFDSRTGVILDDVDIDAIFCIRQVCLMFKKLLLPCSSERERRAYARFIECESEVVNGRPEGYSAAAERFSVVADLIWGSVFGDLSAKLGSSSAVLRPRHGPGATAERISGNLKYDIRTWHSRLETRFPSADFAIPNYSYSDQLDSINFLEPEAEPPVRVITVPKTLKTPRIIAIEPVCMQYTQQAVLEILVDILESHSLTVGSVNFTDQTKNQILALKSSRDGRFATIDLKDASDRVSLDIVKLMLRKCPDLLDTILACRSTTAEVPGQGVVHLAKFASMGSALCFPMEAMVFYTIVVSAVLRERQLQISYKNLLRVKKEVLVYGDDIIVPSDCVLSVIRELEDLNLRVNQHKSFWTGKFRESCGEDAYDGNRVTPVYVRRMLPEKRSQTSEMISTVSLANQMYKAGFWRTCRYLRAYCESIAKIPYVLETSPVIGWHSFLGNYDVGRTCQWTHAPRVYGMLVSETKRRSVSTGPASLMKYFLKRGVEPFQDVKHLEYGGRPVSVDIKMRWAQPY